MRGAAPLVGLKTKAAVGRSSGGAETTSCVAFVNVLLPDAFVTVSEVVYVPCAKEWVGLELDVPLLHVESPNDQFHIVPWYTVD